MLLLVSLRELWGPAKRRARSNFPPHPAAQPRAGCVSLVWPAPAPSHACSPDGSLLKQVERNRARPGNEQGLAPDVRRAGITPKIISPASCKGGAWPVKTSPAPPCNELYTQFDSAQVADFNAHYPNAVPPLFERVSILLYLSFPGKSLHIFSYWVLQSCAYFETYTIQFTMLSGMQHTLPWLCPTTGLRVIYTFVH